MVNVAIAEIKLVYKNKNLVQMYATLIVNHLYLVCKPI